jgi:hypothetical protein
VPLFFSFCLTGNKKKKKQFYNTASRVTGDASRRLLGRAMPGNKLLIIRGEDNEAYFIFIFYFLFLFFSAARLTRHI